LYKIDKKIVSRHVWNKTLLECAKNHTNQLRRFTVKQGGFILGPRCSLYWLNYCLIKTFRSSKITVSWTKTYGWRNHQQIHKFAKYAWQVCQLIEVNPLMGIWKPHSNGPLSSSSSLFVQIKIHDAKRVHNKTWTGQQGGKNRTYCCPWIEKEKKKHRICIIHYN